MALKLIEGNGIAALADPITESSHLARFCNEVYALGTSPALTTSDELSWIVGDAVAVVRSMNRFLVLAEESNEDTGAPSAMGYQEYAAENLRLSESSLGAAFEVLPPE